MSSVLFEHPPVVPPLPLDRSPFFQIDQQRLILMESLVPCDHSLINLVLVHLEPERVTRPPILVDRLVNHLGRRLACSVPRLDFDPDEQRVLVVRSVVLEGGGESVVKGGGSVQKVGERRRREDWRRDVLERVSGHDSVVVWIERGRRSA